MEVSGTFQAHFSKFRRHFRGSQGDSQRFQTRSRGLNHGPLHKSHTSVSNSAQATWYRFQKCLSPNKSASGTLGLTQYYKQGLLKLRKTKKLAKKEYGLLIKEQSAIDAHKELLPFRKLDDGAYDHAARQIRE